MRDSLQTRCPLAVLLDEMLPDEMLPDERSDERVNQHATQAPGRSSARIHIRSVLLVERALGELSREQLALRHQPTRSQRAQGTAQRALAHRGQASVGRARERYEERESHTTSRDAHDSSPPEEQRQLGYFAHADLLRYPPALISGAEDALRSQRSVRLGLGELTEIFLERVERWEVFYEGVRDYITPRRERGGILSLDLGTSVGLTITRAPEGLEISSSLTKPRRVGIYDTSKQALLAEHILPPLGHVRLKMKRELRADPDLTTRDTPAADTIKADPVSQTSDLDARRALESHTPEEPERDPS